MNTYTLEQEYEAETGRSLRSPHWRVTTYYVCRRFNIKRAYIRSPWGHVTMKIASAHLRTSLNTQRNLGSSLEVTPQWRSCLLPCFWKSLDTRGTSLGTSWGLVLINIPSIRSCTSEQCIHHKRHNFLFSRAGGRGADLECGFWGGGGGSEGK